MMKTLQTPTNKEITRDFCTIDNVWTEKQSSDNKWFEVLRLFRESTFFRKPLQVSYNGEWHRFVRVIWSMLNNKQWLKCGTVLCLMHERTKRRYFSTHLNISFSIPNYVSRNILLGSSVFSEKRQTRKEQKMILPSCKQLFSLFAWSVWKGPRSARQSDNPCILRD